jgi:DNA polymerase-3 subunit gamma/tau
VTAMLGLINQAQVLDLLEVVASKNAAKVLSLIEQLADYQPDFTAICGSLLDTLHRVAIEQQVPGALADQLGDLARIQTIAANVSSEEIQVMYQSLLIGRRDLYLAHSARAGFEMLMLRLIAFRPTPPMVISHDALAAIQTAPEVDAPPQTTTEKKTPDDELVGVAVDDLIETPSTPTMSATPTTVIDKKEALASAVTEHPPWEDAPEVSLTEAPSSFEAERIEPLAAEVNEPIIPTSSEDTKLAEAVQSQEAVFSQETTPLQEIEVLEQVSPPTEEKSIANEPEPIPSSEQNNKPFVVAEAEYLDAATDEDDEDEEEAEEREIADIINPFNPAADLVDALGAEPIASPEIEENKEPDTRLSKVPDTIAQPALAMPMPALSHYNELTMKLWWLVAPRLSLTGLVQNILMNSSLVDASDQGIRLEVPLEYGHMLNQVRYEQVQEALSDFFAMSVPLIIDTVEDTSGVTAEEFAASKRAEALQVAIEHLNSHPVVQALSATMDAQLVYDTVKVKA